MTRTIVIEDGLRLRFPNRSDDFALGVEIGMIATALATGAPQVTRQVSSDNREQAEMLAKALGYHVLEGLAHERWVVLTFRLGPCRPRLTLVK